MTRFRIPGGRVYCEKNLPPPSLLNTSGLCTRRRLFSWPPNAACRQKENSTREFRNKKHHGPVSHQLQAENAPFSGEALAFFQSSNSYREVLDRMCAPQSEIVFFDFETTGMVKGQKGHPVQIGMVRLKGGVEVGRFMEFMNPGKPLEKWARENLRDSEGNPLTESWLQSKRPYEQVLRDALSFLGETSIVGGQNCSFDIEVMRDSLQRMGELDRWRPSGHVDSLFIARAVFQGQPLPSSFKLERLAQFFRLPTFAAHDAAEDSLASWHVLRATLQRGQIMQEQGAWAPLPSLPPLITPNVALSPVQMQFQELALQGRNMFVTGGAGTGKSFLLNSIVAQMQLQCGPKSCVVLSPTGAAAHHCRSCSTCHPKNTPCPPQSRCTVCASLDHRRHACPQFKEIVRTALAPWAFPVDPAQTKRNVVRCAGNARAVVRAICKPQRSFVSADFYSSLALLKCRWRRRGR